MSTYSVIMLVMLLVFVTSLLVMIYCTLRDISNEVKRIYDIQAVNSNYLSNIKWITKNLQTEIIDTMIKINNSIEEFQKKQHDEMLDTYKDTLDRMMARNLGEYEAIKVIRTSNPEDIKGGRSSSKYENQKRIIEQNRKLTEGVYNDGEK